ncbi:MAG: hypothetical protein R6X22_02250 [Gemmatimonadota bacterium]
MSWRHRVEEWLNVRPGEGRLVALSFAWAFLMMALVVLARTLREAFYLELFLAPTLPYVTGASVVAGLVAAAAFGRSLERRSPRAVLRETLFVFAAGLLAIRALLETSDPAPGVVAFYLLTVVGSLLVTSGFWLVVTETFVVREAKRLFGLVSAGGTLGWLLAATSVDPILELVGARDVMFVLVGLVGLMLVLLERIPMRAGVPAAGAGVTGRTGEGLRLVLRTPHVRLIAAIVLLIAAASTVIDYQFKEAAQARFGGGDELAGFFGDFYAWTGGLAFLVQLLVTTRFMARAGIAWSVALVPAFLALGSAGMLAAPGLLFATGLRGADTTLRKSLFRSAMEFLWVPVPTAVRRRTKAFVDIVSDSVGEGFGALLVLLWVTLPGLPSRWLSLFVILLCAALLGLASRIARTYFATLRSRLALAGESPDGLLADAAGGRDLLGATLSRIDITRVLGAEAVARIRSGEPPDPGGSGPGATGPGPTAEPSSGPGAGDASAAEVLGSGDVGRITELLRREGVRDPELVPVLVRLLARDRLVEQAVASLVEIGTPAASRLAAILTDESADFVIRRRIPQVLSRIPGEAADRALVDGLASGRFEVRYRSAVALARRRARDMAEWSGPKRQAIWDAIHGELGRGRAVWEMARLLDDARPDPLVGRRIGVRGELSLEHTFRLLSLVLEPEPIRAAYRAVLSAEGEARSFALEYLEQALPPDVRDRLWPFIGDLSAAQERRAIRPLDAVVGDLMRSGTTLFGGEDERDALRRYLEGDPAADGGAGSS